MRLPMTTGVPLLALMLASPVAHAAVTMGGGSAYWEMNYGSCGTWWNGSEGLIMEDPATGSASYGDNDFVSAASPWTQITVQFDYAGTSYTYDNNDGTGSCDWTMSYEYADSAVGYHIFAAGPLDIVRYESLRLTWRITGSGSSSTVPIDYGTDHIVWYEVWNRGASDVTDFQLMVAMNPDVDVARGGSANSMNDVENVDTSDGYADWAGAVGSSGMTIGFAPCDPATASIGFGSGSTDPDTAVIDPGGVNADNSVHFIQDGGTIAADQAVSFGFVLGMGSDDAYTRDYAVDGASGAMSFEYCDCDTDSDGFTGGQCGGADCDDDDPTVNPGATEVWYDGVDQDCESDDDYDADGDGWGTSSDCDDSDASRSPGATEIWYDGIDQDCGGDNDYDADGDGSDSDAHGGDDCDDGNPDVYPGASDAWYDGVDNDCSGSDFDADGDGHDSAEHGGDDCDDTNADVSPSAEEVWYDGIDQDCDESNELDADGDGHDAAEHGGDDCDDANPDISPSAEEVWYDGIDQDCDESTSDADQDGDGHDSAEYGGDDCDDTDGSIWDGCEEIEDDDEDEDDSGAGNPGRRGDRVDWKTTGGHGGCGCASAHAPAPWLLAVFAALTIVLRRRD